MLRSGDAAPDFVLRDAGGRDIRLSAVTGRAVVLCFVPRVNAPGWRLEAKRFAELGTELVDRDVRVVVVSLDGGASETDPMHLRDVEGRVHDLYEAWRTTLFGRVPWAVRRCTYVIDAAGIIRRVHGSVNPLLHARAIVKDLERLDAQESWGSPKAKP